MFGNWINIKLSSITVMLFPLIFFFRIILVFADVHKLNNINGNNTQQYNKNAIKTYQNDTVQLPCYHDTSFRYVRWHKEDVPIVDSRYTITPLPIGLERTRLLPNGSLLLQNVQIEDNGDYYCEMVFTGNIQTVQMHTIQVQHAASVISEPNGIIELPIGAKFEMVCETAGVPQPTITWRHKNNILDEYQIGNRQSRLFEIRNRHMSGRFECIASNGVGQPAISGLYLHVLFTPEMRTTQPIVYTKIGVDAHLECIVLAAPSAAISWYQHNIPVTLDAHIIRHDNELQNNSSLTQYYTELKSMLTIKNVRKTNFGHYECRAHNSIGTKSAYIELTGRPMPCNLKTNPDAHSMTSHVLVWQTESLEPIIDFKLKFRQITTGAYPSTQIPIVRMDWTELTIPSEDSLGPIYTTSYTLPGLQPASVYEVMVLARNKFGWSDKSKIVRFATGGEVELPNFSTESEMPAYELEHDISEIDSIQHNTIEETTFNTNLAAFGRSGGRHTYDYLISLWFLILITFTLCRF